MLIQLTPQQTLTLKDWFAPEQPSLALVGPHVIQTGNGSCWVDRWPDPHAVIMNSAGNLSLRGEPEALVGLPDLKERLSGFVEAPESFVPLLKETFSDLIVWERVLLELEGAPRFSAPDMALVRQLGPEDVSHLEKLSSEAIWVCKTWGGPAGLAASGYGWGAFVENRLASVACTFFVGEQYEELGVATEPGFRGKGLSVACAGALCEAILRRGRRPSWSTSPDNIASLRVAEKLGFRFIRHDCLYVGGISTPAPPQRRANEAAGQ